MSAVAKEVEKPALQVSHLDTETLKLMQDTLEVRMANESDVSLLTDWEDQHEAITEELEYRLTHIVIQGDTVPVRFDRMHGGCVLAYHADNYDLGCPIGEGKDSWSARNELQSLMEDALS